MIKIRTQQPGLPPPLHFATENSRTLRKDLRDLRALQPA